MQGRYKPTTHARPTKHFARPAFVAVAWHWRAYIWNAPTLDPFLLHRRAKPETASFHRGRHTENLVFWPGVVALEAVECARVVRPKHA